MSTEYLPVIIRPLHSPPSIRRLYPQLENLFPATSKQIIPTCASKGSYASDHSQTNSKLLLSNEAQVLHVDEVSSPSLQERVDKLLRCSSEVAMTLLFTDNSTLLCGSQNYGGNIKVEAVYIAVNDSSNLHYIALHFVPMSSSVWSWIRHVLIRLLQTSKLIGYQLNELLSIVISHFQIPVAEEMSVTEWNIFDIGLGAYLLNPDESRPLYTQLLARFNIQATKNKHCYLSTLGPLMLTLYHRLMNEKLWNLFTNMEMKVLPLVAAMEYYGLAADVNLLNVYSEFLKTKMSEIESSAHLAAGTKFSINSTQQLRKILYDDLKLDQKCSKSLDKTPIHKYTSTSEATLLLLQDYHPLPKLVLEYRQLCKVKGLVESLTANLSSEGILKPCWQPCGSSTGRITCCNPNVQAFPKHPTQLLLGLDGTEPRHISIDIRDTLHSRHTYTFVAIDFRSIELCLLAHVSSDVGLMSAIKLAQEQNEDIFELLASEWLGVNHNLVTQEEREKTKRVVYSLIYGIGKEKLSQLLSITSESAKALTTSFLGKYDGVKRFIVDTIEQCRRNKYCVTLCGRKRWFENINSSNYVLRTSAERQCVNFVIQGCAADICKIAMIKIHKASLEKKINARLLVQVHDELLYEVMDKDVSEMKLLLKTLLESPKLLEDFVPHPLRVPLKVKITAGKQWNTLS